MGKLGGYLRLIRPVNCVMMGFAVIVGSALAGSDFFHSWSNLIYGFITGFMLTGASMVINDFYDREIDAVNEPIRPIPSGLIKPKEALAFASLLTGTGFAASYLTNLPSVLCLLTAIIAWTVFVTYTTVGKRSGLPGNLLVSVCVAIPFVYGSLALVDEVELSVLFFAALAFLSNAGREITKGIVDVKGDKTQGIKTLAVRYGERTAAIVASVFYLSAVGLSPLPWFLGIVSFWFIPLVILTDSGLVFSSVTLLKSPSRENARRVKKLVLFWFIIGLFAFILGSLR